MSSRVAVGLLILVALSSCGDGEGASSTTSSPPPESTGAAADTGSSTSTPRMSGEVPVEIMESILSDAADRSNVTVAELAVVKAESVEWPDGALGCPEPGQMYTQAIVPGYWLEIEAGARILDYRSDDQGNFKVCESIDGVTPSTIDR